MSTTRSCPTRNRRTAIAGYEVVEVLRGTESHGCARGRDRGGSPVFLRWRARSDETACKRLVTEYRCLRALGGTSAPCVRDLVWTETEACIVTEWISGAALSESIDPVSAEELDAIAGDLIRLLLRLEATGWVHGDIKPANIVRSVDGRLVVVDWELVTESGGDAAPGTPGWSPAQAWEPGHRAHPRSDLHGAAAVVRALSTGVVERKSRADPEPRMRSGLADALIRSSADSVAEIRSIASNHGAELSNDALEAILARTELAESMRLAVGPAAQSKTVTLDVPAWGADWELHAETAAVDVVRTVLQTSAVGWHTVVDWIERRLSEKVRVGRAEGVDVEAEWVRASAEVLNDIADERTAVIVASLSGSDGSSATRLLWWRSWRGDGRGHSDLQVIRLNLSVRQSETTPRRGSLREAARSVLGVAEPPMELTEVLAHLEPFTVHRALLILQAATLGTVDDCGDGVVGGVRSSESVIASTNESSSATHLESVDRATERAVRALTRGELRTAYAACVRATTEALEDGATNLVERIRLAECWLGVGQPNGCVLVLGAMPSATSNPTALALLGRAYAALGDYGQCRAVGTALSVLGADDGTSITVAAYLRALALIAADDVRGARATVCVARSARLSANERTRVELDLVRANVYRRRRLYGLACRVLQRAEARAARCGETRLALTSHANELLSDRVRPRTALASAWECVSSGAANWGMTRLADFAAATAARIWIEVGDYQRGATVLSTRRETGLAFVSAESRRLAECATISILDRGDKLAEVESHVSRAAACTEVLSRQILLEAETHGTGGGPPESEVARSRDIVIRLTRCAVRAGRRNRTLSGARLKCVVRLASDEFVAGTGLGAHAIRAVGAQTVETWDSALEALRAQVTATDEGRGFRCAVHALALAHGRTRSRASAMWLCQSSSDSQDSRPDGVRAWEWSLAHWVAYVILRGSSPDGAGIGHVLNLALGAGANLTRGREGLYAANVASLVHRVSAGAAAGGSGLGVGVDDSGGVERACGNIDWSVRERSRVSALERVLRSALRLRASISVDEVLSEAVSGVIEVSRAERAAVVFDLGLGGARAKLGTAGHVEDIAPSDAEVSRSVVALLRESDGAVVVDDAVAAESLGDQPSVRKYRARSVMVCPLRTPSRYLGYVYVEDRSHPRAFGATDKEALEGFAAQVALALENAALVEDLRSSYRDLARARSEAVRAESLRALGRLASEVAHDLNNLLTAVLGEAQLLLSDPRVRDGYTSLRVIERAAQDGAECIRRIQDSTRVRGTAEFEEIEVGDLARSVLDLTRVRCEATGPGGAVNVVLDITDRPVVRGVASELREVLMNLVVNGIDAMPSGGELRVTVGLDGEQVVVAVRDSGCGIPPAVLSRLFEPFFTTKGARGNGLGLSIAQSVVRRHGGEIDVESEVGHGTCVRVRLPRGRSLRAGAGLIGGSAAVGGTERTSSRFLIVDDDPSVLRVLGQMLGQAGAQVDAVVGGSAALSRLNAVGASYNCVITDLFMPEISGLDVVDHAKRKHPDATIVVMSGCSSTLAGEAAQNRGIARVLRKPFDLDAVGKLVADCRLGT